jgi:D-amino peptidase
MSRIASAFCLLLLLLPEPAMSQRPLKVYISADMEGVAGVVTGEQLGPAGFEYQRFREFMTLEVLAAIQGARDAGATEIVVSDSHGNAQNILIERLPADVTLIRSFPRPLSMMEGIDTSFHAVVFLGYHSATTSLAGVRAHTISSARFTSIELNGTPMPESGINAAVAGHFGVPVVAITGDDVAVAEAQALIGPMEGAVVKRAIGFHSAATLTPEAAQPLIREAVRRGVERRATMPVYRMPAPVRLDVTFKNYRPAELLAYLPIVERPTAHSIRYLAPDVLEAVKFLVFIGSYSPDIDP